MYMYGLVNSLVLRKTSLELILLKHMNIKFLLKYWRQLGISAIIVAIVTLITNQNNNQSNQIIARQNNQSAREIETQKIDGTAKIETQKAEEAKAKETREIFSNAIKNINNDDNQTRKSAIRGIRITWNDILKESPEKQWEIVEALASSITTYPKFSGDLDIKNKRQAIQIALNTLKSRNPQDDNKGKKEDEADRIIGLAATNLKSYDLSNGKFPKASFDYSNLDNAILTRANLKGSFFIGSSLKGANLENVDLSEAHVKGSDLAGADLSGADLSNSNLKKTNFFRANLKNVDLTGSNITEQQITQACNWRSAEDSNGKIDSLKQKYTYKKKSGCEKFE
jgi:hypothetical protein